MSSHSASERPTEGSGDRAPRDAVIVIPSDFEGEIEITIEPEEISEPLPLNSPDPEGEEA